MTEFNCKNSIVAIIPARGGSKGIRNKNYINFANKPLLGWTITQALQSKYISEIYITSNDEEILSIAKQYGANIINRPDEICTDDSSSEEAIHHAIPIIENEHNKSIKTIVFLQCTSPLRKINDIDDAIDLFLDKKCEALFSGSPIDDMTLWEEKDGKLNPVTYDYNNRQPRQKMPNYFIENGSIYIFDKGKFLISKNRLFGNFMIYKMEGWQANEIDTIQSSAICEKYFIEHNLNLYKSSKSKKYPDLIVYDFDGVFTDNKVYLNVKNEESILCNRGDGLAISKIKDLGIEQIILSSEKQNLVKLRASKLKITAYNNINNKLQFMNTYCKDYNINIDNIIFIGNDLNDLSLLQNVKYPMCPMDAIDEVKKICKIININGGNGVIREFFLKKYYEL